MTKYIVPLFVTGSISLCAAFPLSDWSPKLTQKVEAATQATFESEAFTLDPYTGPQPADGMDIMNLSKNMRTVRRAGDHTLLGYAYVDQAASMKNVFDYIVLFDENLKIINTKVLIYREQHGRQIGTKRWLSQFFGLTPTDRPELGNEIDGISGATISATSMTTAVRDLLTTLDGLPEHKGK